jgi:hypothetical protein
VDVPICKNGNHQAGIQRIADDVIAYVRPAIRMSKTPNFRCGAMPATIQFSPVKLKNARKK